MLVGDGSPKVVNLEMIECVVFSPEDFTSGERNRSPPPCLLGVAGELDMILVVNATDSVLERIR